MTDVPLNDLIASAAVLAISATIWLEAERSAVVRASEMNRWTP